MEKTILAVAAAALGATALMLILRTINHARARPRARAGYFDACARLLRAPIQAVAPTGFGRVSGAWDGLTVDLQAVPDTLTFRKLPALWVLVTLPGPLPVRATFDLMIRPTGVEPFSHFDRLPDQIVPPPGFPDDCAIRTDNPTGLPPETLLRQHLSLFDDPRVKELVISPKGVRLVWLAEEAERGRYLIFRDAEMGRTPLEPADLMPLLNGLAALRRDLLTADTRKEGLPA